MNCSMISNGGGHYSRAAFIGAGTVRSFSCSNYEHARVLSAWVQLHQQFFQIISTHRICIHSPKFPTMPINMQNVKFMKLNTYALEILG